MAGKGRHPLFEDVPDDELEGDGPAPFLQKAQSKGKGSSIFQSNRGSMFKGSSQRYVQDTEASYQEEDGDVLHRYKDALLAAQPAQYMLDFEDEAANEAIMVGQVQLVELETERARQEVEERQALVHAEEKHAEFIHVLNKRAEEAEHNLKAELKEKMDAEEERIQALSNLPKESEKKMLHWFRAAKSKIRLFIGNRRTNTHQAYGDVKIKDDKGFDKRHVDWSRVPQQVEIRVQALRGVKDKLRADTYILLLSKWTKLGGDTVRWTDANVYSEDPPYCPLHDPLKLNQQYFEMRESCEICQGLVGASQPVWHGGTNKDLELVLNCAIHGFFPAEKTIRPYTVMLFELMRIEDHYAHRLNLPTVRNRRPQAPNPYNLAPTLGGRGQQADLSFADSRTVAWGCFPVINNRFQIIKGRFKLPMHRGVINEHLEHFAKYEEVLADDLEAWAGNLYFDVIPWPRTKDGLGEFDIDQKYSRQMLGLDKAENPYWELDDHNNWVAMKQQIWEHDDRRRSTIGVGVLPKTAHGKRKIVYKPLVQKPEAHQLLEESEDTATDSEAHDVSHDNLSDELDSEVEEVPPEAAGPRRVSGRPSIAPSDVSGRRPSTIAGRNSIDPARPRTARRPTQVSLQAAQTGKMWVPSEIRKMLEEKASKPRSSRRKLMGGREADEEKEEQLLRELRKFNQHLPGSNGQGLVDRSEKWSKYKYMISPEGTFADEDYRWWVQVQFVWRAILDELKLRHPFSLKFLVIFVLFLLVMWAQLFVRGLGLYAGLLTLGIPGSIKVTFREYGLLSAYKAHYMRPFDEIFIILLAQFIMHVLIMTLIVFGRVFTKVTGSYPMQLSKFVYLFQIGTFVVPFIVLAIDTVEQTRDSDLSRLLRFFVTKRYSSFFAYISFFVMYLIMQTLHCIIIYVFTMYVHMNGILIDVYTRITVMTEEVATRMFVPMDFEVSLQEIEFVVDKAERWRGLHGERRKTLVEEIITTDANDPDWSEVQVRIAIYTLDVEDPNFHKYKPKQIFREFYVLANGAIIEAVNNRQPPSAAYVIGKLDNAAALGRTGARPSLAPGLQRRSVAATTQGPALDQYA